MNLATRTLQLAGRGSLTSAGVESLLAKGGQLVDVGAPEDLRQGALAGSLNLPLDAMSYDFRLLDKHEPVILCGPPDATCVRAARLLAGQGFAHIYHFSAERPAIA